SLLSARGAELAVLATTAAARIRRLDGPPERVATGTFGCDLLPRRLGGMLIGPSDNDGRRQNLMPAQAAFDFCSRSRAAMSERNDWSCARAASSMRPAAESTCSLPRVWLRWLVLSWFTILEMFSMACVI